MRESKKKFNVTVISNGLVFIYLNGKNARGLIAVTDIDSFNKYNLGRYNWVSDGKGTVDGKNQGYAVAYDKETKKTVAMHRIVSENDTPNHTDHWNQRTLDNCSSNLRICTTRENNYNAGLRVDNTSGYKNVSEQYGKYVTQIRINKKKWNFGTFDKKEVAAEAYNYAMSVICPDFAYYNDIPNDSLNQEEIEFAHRRVDQTLSRLQDVG